MQYRLKIYSEEDVTDQERLAAEMRFRAALEEALGSEDLVWPAYKTYLRLLQLHGDHMRPWPVSPEEQLLIDQWEAAELAATRAAFGAERYLGDAHFELGP